MNRSVSKGLPAAGTGALPPEARQSRVRMLFLSDVEFGFKHFAEQLVARTAVDEEIDAVHVTLSASTLQRVLGKSIAPVRRSGWDFHDYRHALMWRWIIGGWLRGPMSLRRFDVVHILTQDNAMAMLDIRRSEPTRFAVNLDITAVQAVRDMGRSAWAWRPMIAAERRMFQRADLIVCRNRYGERSVREDYGVEPERICLACNSMKLPARARTDGPAVNGRPARLVFVGHDFERKGGRELLRMHQSALADAAELHICSARAKPDGSARNVVWHGDVPRGRLIGELLPTMDVFVLPTRCDGLPWAIVEAASVGVPVVSTRVGSIPEVVQDGVTGLLCEAGDWAGVAEAVRRLLGNPNERERMGRAAREHIRLHYDPDRIFGDLLARLKRLAGGGACRETGMGGAWPNRDVAEASRALAAGSGGEFGGVVAAGSGGRGAEGLKEGPGGLEVGGGERVGDGGKDRVEVGLG